MLIPASLNQLAGIKGMEHFASALLTPLDPNHVTAPIETAQIFADKAKSSAIAYEFDEASVDATFKLTIDRLRIHMMETCHPPSPKAFFELILGDDRAGILIRGATHTKHIKTREWRIAAKRGRLRNPAVLSYNRVSLQIPHDNRGEIVSRVGHGSGVRFHDVRGHWKQVTLRDDEKILRWIAAYWRGDVNLGVVAKERAVHVSH